MTNMVTVIRDLNYLPICRNRNKAEEDNLSQCEKLTYSQHVKLHEVKMKALFIEPHKFPKSNVDNIIEYY